MQDDVPSGVAALSAHAADFLDPGGTDLLRRWGRHQAFWDARLAAGLDFTARATAGPVGAEARAVTRAGTELAGVNFASQDHLSLARHPAVRAAAVEALGSFGTHAAGPAPLQGGSRPLLLLEERLADLLCCREATAFPTGWAAGYGAIRALVGPADHVLIDCLARPCLREAAAAATRNLHPMPPGGHDAVRQRLDRLRREDPRAGILVVAETVAALDASVPDLAALRDACRDFGATLMVWLGHDFGAAGNGGLGFLGSAGLVGEVDVLAGSLAPAFATGGGFVAGDAPGLKQALHHASTLAASCALSPVQAAIALASLRIMGSAEGAQRRRRLAANVARLREGLLARAFRVLGEPGGIVPVVVGEVAEARLMTRTALARGALVNLMEHPAVARGESRWPLCVMADHTPDQIDRMVGIAVAAREAAPAHQPRPVPCDGPGGGR